MEKVAKKPKATRTITTTSGASGVFSKIPLIKAMVEKHLGVHREQLALIRDADEYANYINVAIQTGIVAIDTETSSLDPISCTIAGISLYTPSYRGAYIPINHIDYMTNELLENQLTIEVVKDGLQRLKDAGTRIVMFNAKFDTRVISNQVGIKLEAYWDAYIAARLLNENEPVSKLKPLHAKYCGGDPASAFSFSDLFESVPFMSVPPSTAYLYAAWDAVITYELYEFQKPFLSPDDPLCIDRDLLGVANVFRNIEMPLIPVVAEMEDTGIMLDVQAANRLAIAYQQKLKQELEDNFGILGTFGAQLDDYRKRMGNANKLEYPVNIGSPTQVAIMLYDILKIPPVDPKKPRGTGEDILEKIDHPIAKSIVRYRGLSKLLGTYIEKLPNSINPKTGRIHASFNQMGTDTGRFSSSDPNMQNIPRDNKDIRQMFGATDGYVLMSSDYSAQEPRLTAHMSKDTKMIAAYCAGKDLYVEIAALAFGLPSSECAEFRPDGSKNPEGKKRRQTAKAIVLGVCYGKGVPAIADDLGISVKKAQEIYDKIMQSFPGLKQFMVDSETMAITYGFVTTVWGRKRRLPNIQLPKYEFVVVGGSKGATFDPLADEVEETEPTITATERATYTMMLDKAYGREARNEVKKKLLAKGIKVVDNGGFIAEAKRQTVNSRIQGSAADQTKLAMILVGNDQPLRDMGFRLLLTVHDELIGEAPIPVAKEASERFAFLMVEAAKELSVPSKCDVEITTKWQGEAFPI